MPKDGRLIELLRGARGMAQRAKVPSLTASVPAPGPRGGRELRELSSDLHTLQQACSHTHSCTTTCRPTHRDTP